MPDYYQLPELVKNCQEPRQGAVEESGVAGDVGSDSEEATLGISDCRLGPQAGKLETRNSSDD
jgi:hypothetical protein